ncbi:hypothetical protein H7F33_18100 [Pedobacter sp. PAMC26386]|nr:hypothetical protein H7F33_18100 [Pedobacter sp. PAMC26386]
MNLKFTLRRCLLLILAFLIVSSCRKEVLPEKLTDASQSSLSKNANLLAGNPTPPLDWENISFMPAPAGTSPIPVPWQGGLGGAKIDDNMVFDYKSINGWELVYNTFSAATVYNPSYFMLYNKYRGLLRVYFYIAPGGNYPSSNITHFLNLRGASSAASPLLNFAAQDLVDYNVRSMTVGQIQPYKVSTTGAWYAAEFEMAYDPGTAGRPYDQFRLEWQINPNSITNISLNGTQTGDLTGTISSKSGGPSFFGGIANGILDGALKIGGDSAAKLSFLPALIKDPVISASKSALGGIIKGFFSGILGGTSNTSVETVNLKINTKIKITGTATTESQLFDNVFSIPGTQGVVNTVPFYPNYALPMGVFYISGKPRILETVYSDLVNDENGEYYNVDQRYGIDETSYQLIFNPEVTKIANITNISKQVVMMDVLDNGGLRIGGTLEQVAENVVYTGTVTGIQHSAPRPNTISLNLGLRVSFDVVPKDGSPKCTIVKTFLANKG